MIKCYAVTRRKYLEKSLDLPVYFVINFREFGCKFICPPTTFLFIFFKICYSVGCIFCGPKEPIKACTRFRARILIFNIEIPVTKGFPVSF